VTAARVRVAHEEHIAAAAAEVWPFFDWPNLERMQPAGLFAEIRYAERRPIAGATRSIRLGGDRGKGAVLNEILERCDADVMQLRYRIADPAPMPIADYRGEVSVIALDETRCVVRFSCDCTLNGIEEAQWRELYCAMQRESIGFIRRALSR
jgi:hypothetical protein